MGAGERVMRANAEALRGKLAFYGQTDLAGQCNKNDREKLMGRMG